MERQRNLLAAALGLLSYFMVSLMLELFFPQMSSTPKNVIKALIFILVLAFYVLYFYFFRSEGARKREKIERTDERNQMLRRTASMYTLVSLALLSSAQMLYCISIGKPEFNVMLSISTLVGIFLYYIFYAILNRKY